MEEILKTLYSLQLKAMEKNISFDISFRHSVNGTSTVDVVLNYHMNNSSDTIAEGHVLNITFFKKELKNILEKKIHKIEKFIEET